MPVLFLDDTGASDLIIAECDITALNLPPNYLEAAFLDTMAAEFSPVTPYIPFEFAVSELRRPTRLGGPLLTGHLWFRGPCRMDRT